MFLEDDKVFYLACYDSDQCKQWLSLIKKAKQFYNWYNCLKELMTQKDNLEEKMSIKLGEILQFVEQFSTSEQEKIEFVDKEVADARDRKKNLLRMQEMLNKQDDNSYDDEEFKSANGSGGSDGEQGPIASPINSEAEQRHK